MSYLSFQRRCIDVLKVYITLCNQLKIGVCLGLVRSTPKMWWFKKYQPPLHGLRQNANTTVTSSFVKTSRFAVLGSAKLKDMGNDKPEDMRPQSLSRIWWKRTGGRKVQETGNISRIVGYAWLFTCNLPHGRSGRYFQVSIS